MKKVFIVLGVVFLILVVLGAVGITKMAKKGKALDAESKAFVEKVASEILADWNVDKTLEIASPEFMQGTTEEQLKELLSIMSQKLGKLKSIKDIKGQSHMLVDTKRGKVITAQYIVMADFENDEAQVIFRLKKHEGNWQLFAFHVNSKALALQ